MAKNIFFRFRIFREIERKRIEIGNFAISRFMKCCETETKCGEILRKSKFSTPTKIIKRKFFWGKIIARGK